ncbi:MAG: DUF1549 domain-containing protein [Planctomycetota bacterium]
MDVKAREMALAKAARIDELVDSMHRKHDVTANEPLTDEQFVRRIYLDICGVIPTLNEIATFLRDRRDDKRANLIDRLLNSEGYVEHAYNQWANTLRIQTRGAGGYTPMFFIEWLENQLRDNVPYDDLVRSMLTAEGRYVANPAVGYLQRDRGMELIGVGNTARVFLSTRIECAQCHDHPFDVWTQNDFLQFSAFSQTAYLFQSVRRGNNESLKKASYKAADFGVDIRDRGNFGRFLKANEYGVYSDDELRLRYPKDYAYEDAKPRSIVRPAVLWDEYKRDGKTWREAFADWLTSEDNERFNWTVVNRLWRQAFGVGLVEPYDDISSESEPPDPELMDYLVDLIKEVDYDVKEFQRVIYNTDAYQRLASSDPPDAYESYYFPGPLLRRMTAEQVWDSFLTLTVVDPYEYQRPSYEPLRRAVTIDVDTVSAQEAVKRFQKHDEMRRGYDAVPRKYRYQGVELVRSTELRSPLPPEHFLSQFGQGTRDIIEGRNEDGSVPQILTMFNGPVTHMLLEPHAVMYQTVVSARDRDDVIDRIFLTILSRTPNRFERAVATKEIDKYGNSGIGNVIWALVNTREFLFIR